MKIKFGTDGWRAIIAQEFTVDNVAKVSEAVARWILSEYKNPVAVVGYDCRFNGKLFAETVSKVFAVNGIKVLIPESFVSTPMISFGIKKLKANFGVVITASHNPPEYNGYKLKGEHGGPLLENDVKDIEAMIPEENEIVLESVNWDEIIAKKQVEYVDLENIYIDHLKSNFPIEKIKNSGFNFAFDAMFGSGQNVIKKLLPDVINLHCEWNPLFNFIPPEPLHRNLKEFSDFIHKNGNIDCGLAVDGDADRIALYNNEGEYVDSHHIILLLIHYLAGYKKMSGKVVTGVSSTVKIEKLCAYYKLPVQRVRIGFKDICKIMLKEDVLVGGEESGGIAVKGHIPERDGIWMGFLIWQFMTETNKSLNELINEIYEITGSFAFERRDLKITDNIKKKAVENCKNGVYKSFGSYKVTHIEEIDGYKFFFSENEWLMIRPSGTEPVLRTYAEASTKTKALDILDQAYTVISKQ
ncbi:MAG: phosphoglucomutase/phosphomannomutase family protein [Bacteroidota bacterium]